MFDQNAEPFKASTLSTYNVFESARKLGIKNLVWASSETLLGPPFDVPPRLIPVDEEYPAQPETNGSSDKLDIDTPKKRCLPAP